MLTLKAVVMAEDEVEGRNIVPGRYAHLTVSDTGNGMPAELMAKIFDPYFTTKERGKGTGLGLAVAYGIINAHNGDIRVYSELGKGTTFNVYLPLMDGQAPDTRQNGLEIIQGGHERILLVDDEPSIVSLEKKMLGRLGYHCVTYTSSIDALDAFKETPRNFDLVITDMTMPDMTGEQLAWEIRKIRQQMPIILCTGFSEHINQEKALHSGINGFLMKPVIKSEMTRMIRDVLDAPVTSPPLP